MSKYQTFIKNEDVVILHCPGIGSKIRRAHQDLGLAGHAVADDILAMHQIMWRFDVFSDNRRDQSISRRRIFLDALRLDRTMKLGPTKLVVNNCRIAAQQGERLRRRLVRRFKKSDAHITTGLSGGVEGANHCGGGVALQPKIVDRHMNARLRGADEVGENAADGARLGELRRGEDALTDTGDTFLDHERRLDRAAIYGCLLNAHTLPPFD